MLSRIFPRCVDNTYRGHRVALWLFGLVVFMRIGMGLGSIFDGYAIASGPDGIPLDTYTPAGAQTVVSLFAHLGLATLLIGLLCVVVLARYRSLVPLMFVVLLLQTLGGRLILLFLPIARSGTPRSLYVNLALIALMAVGFALSLRSGEPDAHKLAPSA